MLHQPTLLLGRFRPHKSHPRPANCLADRLRVSRVVLVALDVSLHIPRRHQPNLVTEPRQLTCPVVRAGPGFDGNEAGRQSFEELHHLTAAKLLPDDDPLGRVNAVNLENVLGDIQTDCGNLHVDGSLMWFVATITLRRFVAGAGAVHHITSGLMHCIVVIWRPSALPHCYSLVLSSGYWMIIPECGSTQAKWLRTALTPETFSAATIAASRWCGAKTIPHRSTMPSRTVTLKCGAHGWLPSSLMI